MTSAGTPTTFLSYGRGRDLDGDGSIGSGLNDGLDQVLSSRLGAPGAARDQREARIWEGTVAESNWLPGLDSLPLSGRGHGRRDRAADRWVQPAVNEPGAADVVALDEYFAQVADAVGTRDAE